MSENQRTHFTSESVTEGHPDKVADQISDAVLDAVLAQDPHGRVACETLVTTDLTILAGEITSRGKVDYASVVRQTIRDIGYTDTSSGFDAEGCKIMTEVHQQSPDIAMGVDPGGAGDQGMMFGYACNETPELMPLPITLAHRLVKRLSTLRREGKVDYLRPDGKCQVTVEYDGGVPVRVNTVVISTQHSEDATTERLREEIPALVIDPVVPADLIDRNTRRLVNPTGRFVVGGPAGDTGVTGRKIIVDTYGGMGHHGGGAFSGKDPTKVDRSASYMARYIAKNAVAGGLADRLEVQLAYAIGVAEPVSIMAQTFGTGKLEETRIAELIRERFDLTPTGIIEHLDLRRPIFQKTAVYGHFGRTGADFTWERTDRAAELRKAAGL